jgi:hypothetical protein
VALSISSGAEATVELIDLHGRILNRTNVSPLGSGDHVFNVSSGLDLAPGVYIVRLTRGDQSVSRKAVVVP